MTNDWVLIVFFYYEPTEWSNFLYLACFCAFVVGIISGIKDTVAIRSLLWQFIIAMVLSGIFDFLYLQEFKEEGITYPKPLFSCNELNTYIESRGAGEALNASSWQSIAESSDCLMGSISSVMLSGVLISILFFLVGVLLGFIAQFINVNKKNDQNGATSNNLEMSPVSQPNEVGEHEGIREDAPIFFEESLDDDDRILLDNICTALNRGEAQLARDGEVFISFVMDGLSLKNSDDFENEFTTPQKKGRIRYSWESFKLIKSSKNPNKNTAKNIISNIARFKKIPLTDFLALLVIYYSRRSDNEAWLKNTNQLKERINSRRALLVSQYKLQMPLANK